MSKIFCLLAGIYFFTGFYDYPVKDINGADINLSSFTGKKILVVNTASKSMYTGQYAQLEQLYQKYKDSLVIIAFPSNSFGNETGDNMQIKKFISNRYNTHFIIAEKTIVAGENQCPLYKWLTHTDLNGMMNNAVNNDFYKFLIDGSGRLVGAFVPTVDPMSDELQNAIKN